MFPLSITASDGIILGAMLYRSKTKTPSLTVVSIDPYRSQTYAIDSHNNLGTMLQRNGYNYVVVDVRGTGKSEGIAIDEYSQREQEDTKNIIDFIVSQSWSNSKIAFHGISYSAFVGLNSLHRRHVVTAFLMHGSDDRWKTDVHWWGGIKTVTDWLQYATAMNVFNVMPKLRGHTIKKQNKPWVRNWITKDPLYWKNGSVALTRNIKKIMIPTLLYGGFHDIYIDAMIRLHKDLPNNILIVSDQGHDYPKNHYTMLLWWLKNFKSVRGQTNYYLPQKSKQWVKIHEKSKDIQYHWNINMTVPNDYIYGVLFRNNAESVCKISLLEQLRKKALEFKLKKHPLSQGYIVCAPVVSLIIKNVPDDFYLVAWMMDNKGYLYSSGAMRWVKKAKHYEISMSPVCISVVKSGNLSLFIGKSNLPNLIPQFWLKGNIEIEKCSLSLEIHSKNRAKMGDIPLPNNKVYVDDNNIQSKCPAKELSLKYMDIQCSKKCIGACECGDETLTIRATQKMYHAKFNNRVKIDGLKIQAMTTLKAFKKTGVLGVEIKINGKTMSRTKNMFEL